jgi:hypothetical protein
MGLRAAVLAGMKQLEKVLSKQASKEAVEEARPLLNRVLLSADSEALDDATKQLVKDNKDEFISKFKTLKEQAPPSTPIKAKEVEEVVEDEVVPEAEVALTQQQIDMYRKKYDIPVDAKGVPVKEKGSMNRTWKEKQTYWKNTAKPFDIEDFSEEEIQDALKNKRITEQEATQLRKGLGSK